MTNEEIYENVMGHKPNKEFGIKGSFSWDDIDALMNAVKNCSIPDVSNLVLLAKSNYKAKDGTIKQGIEVKDKYYAPQNDCYHINKRTKK